MPVDHTAPRSIDLIYVLLMFIFSTFFRIEIAGII